ncbi:MAG: hypothetical protein AAGB34_11835, partial [Planctomycetota bacterium]
GDQAEGKRPAGNTGKADHAIALGSNEQASDPATQSDHERWGMSVALYVKPDLSEAQLVVSGRRVPETWHQSISDADPEASVTGPELAKRANELASWYAAHEAGSNRLDALIIDPAESACAWVRVRSTVPPVLAAAFAQRAEQLSAQMHVGSVELLHDTEPEAIAERGVVVMRHADGPIRLLLDALDRKGVRVATTCSLWHALASRHDELGCSIVLVGNQAVWAWGEGQRLVAAGHTRLASDPAVVARRLALDFMSFAAQLGRKPQDASIFAEDAERAKQIAESVRVVETRVIPEEHAIAKVVITALDSGSPKLDSLSGLHHRPNRKTRRSIRLVAASLLLIAVAVAGLGWRFSSSSEAWLNTTASISSEGYSRLSKKYDDQVPKQYDQFLDGKLATLRNRDPEPLPAGPKQLFDAIGLVCSEIAKREGATIRNFTISNGDGVNLTVLVADRDAAIDFELALQQSEPRLEWRLDRSNRSGSQEQAVLSARWPR